MTLFNSLNSKKRSKQLKDLLDSEKLVTLPGCYDALSAKMIETIRHKSRFYVRFLCIVHSARNARHRFNFLYRNAKPGKKYLQHHNDTDFIWMEIQVGVMLEIFTEPFEVMQMQELLQL